MAGRSRPHSRFKLLAATEQDLAQIADRVNRGTLLGADQIGLAVGPALKRYRMRKHFQIAITDTTFTYTRDTAGIAAEAALDGFYILRTSLTETDLAAGDVVRAYKNLEQAERAFGSIKGPELQIRPIHHRLETRVRAHVLICMLAYHLTWHLKAAWKPLLFTDEHRPDSPDPVAKAVRSPGAQQKAQTKRTSTGQPAHSARTLLAELATQTRNTTRLHGHTSTFEKLTHRPPSKPKPSISPRTPPSWSFGRHDPNTPNPPKTLGIRGNRLPHQGNFGLEPEDWAVCGQGGIYLNQVEPFRAVARTSDRTSGPENRAGGTLAATGPLGALPRAFASSVERLAT
jgi:hypothetical protein